MAGQLWTAERDALLAELWADGLSMLAIGQRMGVTKNSVVGRVHRLHLPPRPSPIRPAGSGKPHAKVARINAPRGHQAVAGDTLSQLIPDVVMPATRITQGGREVAVNNRRDAIAGPTLSTTQARPAAFGAVAAARACQWPVSEDRPWRFCGGRAAAGRSYCPAHAERAVDRTLRTVVAREVGF